MKYTFAALLLCFISVASFAQTKSLSDSWKITLNKNKVINVTREDETTNVKAITKKDIAKKSAELAIAYKEAKSRPDWIRSIIIVDENDNELIKKPINGTLVLGASDLKKLLASSSTWRIYTMALPKDPAKAAVIRVRRVHLYTLTVK